MPINQVAHGDLPQVRPERDVTGRPILEQRMESRTPLALTEKVRIRRLRSDTHAPQTFVLPKGVVIAERPDGCGGIPGGSFPLADFVKSVSRRVG